MSITIPNVGDSTKQSLIAAIINALTTQGAIGNSVFNSSNGCPNLINGSFELDQDNNGIADNWTSAAYPSGTVALDNSSGNYDHGAWAVKFTQASGGGSNGGGTYTSNDFLPVSPNKNYALRFLTKSSVANFSNQVNILWYKADQTASTTPSTTVWSDNSANPTSWAYRAGTATPPSDAFFCKVQIVGGVVGNANTGSSWFDGVEFFKLNQNYYNPGGSFTIPIYDNTFLMVSATSPTITLPKIINVSVTIIIKYNNGTGVLSLANASGDSITGPTSIGPGGNSFIVAYSNGVSAWFTTTYV